VYKSASKEHNFLPEARHYVQGIVDDIKRAQNSFKRDIKRAQNSFKESLTTSKEPKILSKELYMISREPLYSTKRGLRSMCIAQMLGGLRSGLR